MIRFLSTALVVFMFAAVFVAAWFEHDFRRGLDDRRFARKHRVVPPRVDGPRFDRPRRVADPSPVPKRRAS